MGSKLIQHDNLDKVPQGGASHDSAPWAKPPRVLFDWRGLGVLCAFLLLTLLIGYWLFGRDVRSWLQYGGGQWVVPAALALAFIYSALMGVRRMLLIEQRGFKVFVWNANAPRVIEQLIRVEAAYAARTFPNAAQLTLTNTALAPALDDGMIEAEIIDAGPALIPDSEWLAWIDRTPHLLLAGRTDAGKTTFAEAILAERIQAGDQIVICDPHYQPGKWHGIDATANIETILSQLARLEQELATRFDAFNAGKPTDDFQRLTILLDEVPAIVEETFRMTPAGTKKIIDDRWARFARRLGSQARKVRISVILLSQTIFVEDLMINSAYRENFVRVGLGDKARPLLAEEKRSETRTALYELLRGQSHPAAFEHNGEIHLLDTSRVVALASRRIGHMAQLWTLPPQIARAVVSASAQPSTTVRASVAMPEPGAIVYPPVVKTTNGKIAWLLSQHYSYRQIERELSVSHETISKVKKAMEI